VTLWDVAVRAGVSQTTASFVLSGRRDMRISQETAERVWQAARTLDYRRRIVPRTTLPEGAPVIGLVSDVVATESFAGEMLRGCIAAAADRGHVVLIADSEGVDDLEASSARALQSRGVDRFLYATLATIERRVPDVLRHSRIVLLNNVDKTLDVPAVIPDDAHGGRTAAEALLTAGHGPGIWVAGRTDPRSVAGRRRLSGVRAALRAAGVPLGGHVRCNWWPDETRAAFGELFRDGWFERERPTAVIAMNDRAAMGVYQAAAAAGLRVPDDLSVVSFDNSDVARWLVPGLTSVALPYFDLGRRAVELLLDEDAGRGAHKLPMALSTRGSVGPPRPAPIVGPRGKAARVAAAARTVSSSSSARPPAH
jgi:LacI family transcriptional regulator